MVKRIVIQGAGLSGLSVAWHLQKKGIDCLIFEKEKEIGGLCRSKKINGFTFDYDGHILHFKHSYAFNLLKNLLKNSLIEHKRNAWINLYDRYIRYPFQSNLYGLPHKINKECLSGFLLAQKNGNSKEINNINFRDWIYETFGKGVARHFMLPYNEKFWTVPCQDLTCEWLDGFICVPSLRQAIQGAKKESQEEFGYNARFWYPKEGGIEKIPQAFASQIKNIHTKSPIIRLDYLKKEIALASGKKEKFDYLVSTIPLPEIPLIIGNLPKGILPYFKKLRWNSIFNLNLGIEQKDTNRFHWVYYPCRNISFFRAGFYHNFSSNLAPKNKSALYAELSYSGAKPVDKNKFSRRIKEDLKKVGILNGKDNGCVEDVNDIKYGYPIFDKNYRKAREKIIAFLNQNHILSCGRYGSWRYMSMEDVILDGKATADKIMKLL